MNTNTKDYSKLDSITDATVISQILKHNYEMSVIDGLNKMLADPEMDNVYILRKHHKDGPVHFVEIINHGEGKVQFACCDIKEVFTASEETKNAILTDGGIKPLLNEQGDGWASGEDQLRFTLIKPAMQVEVEKLQASTTESSKVMENLGIGAEVLPLDVYNKLGARYQMMKNPGIGALAAMLKEAFGGGIEVGIVGVSDGSDGEEKPTLH
jgi:hypothetical protein